MLHLGDFIYEIVWYPEDRPQGMYDRRLRDIVRFKDGEKIRDFHAAVTLDDYRNLYRSYLQDPDLQDARARWPFVCVWDNHEFSWRGWQGFVKTVEAGRPAQTRKVAANQAWFEFQPARIAKPGGGELERFAPPKVVDAPVERFDEHGIGQEPNNLAAIDSLHIYRRLRFGRNVDLVLTDQRSFQTECAMDTAAIGSVRQPRLPEPRARGSERDLRRRPRLRERQAAGDDPLRHAADRRMRARIHRRTACSALRRSSGSCSS